MIQATNVIRSFTWEVNDIFPLIEGLRDILIKADFTDAGDVLSDAEILYLLRHLWICIRFVDTNKGFDLKHLGSFYDSF